MVIYSDPSDDYAYGHSTTYATARSTGAAIGGSGAWFHAGQRFVTPDYDCFEAFLGFDTSLVSAPTSALLSLVEFAGPPDTNLVVEARLYDFGTSVTIGDFVAGASLGAQTLLATYDTVNGWGNSNVRHEFTDVAMVANLNLAGFTRMMLSSDRHRLGTTPVDIEYIQASSANQTGTTSDPKLTIDNDTGDPGSAGPVPDDDNLIPPFQQTVAP